MLTTLLFIFIFIFCRTRVVWVTYDHINNDVHKFVNNDQYRIMAQDIERLPKQDDSCEQEPVI